MLGNVLGTGRTQKETNRFPALRAYIPRGELAGNGAEADGKHMACEVVLSATETNKMAQGSVVVWRLRWGGVDGQLLFMWGGFFLFLNLNVGLCPEMPVWGVKANHIIHMLTSFSVISASAIENVLFSS